jgi:DNA-binding LytR/AlgR family response regulator
MIIAIIEDELDAYKRLKKLVSETFQSTASVVHLDSVAHAVKWFNDAPMPDVVFIDINLGDGSGFDVLNQVNLDCPYVFTTAYDDYAIEAFQTNSIAYLLKPVTKEDLETVLKKIEDYQKMFTKPQTAKSHGQPKYKKRFVIRYGEHIKVVNTEEIAYAYVLNGGTFIRTFEGRSYAIDYNLEMLEEMLDPQEFFRINRQFLASLNSIAEMRTYSKGRIIITLKPVEKSQQIVSSERAAEFKHWLGGEV